MPLYMLQFIKYMKFKETNNLKKIVWKKNSPKNRIYVKTILP